MSVKEKLTEAKANYLQLEGKTYALREVKASHLDIEKEIREFYRIKYENLSNHLTNVVGDQMAEEWRTGLDRLANYNTNGNITIPPSLINKPVCAFNGYLLELRLTTYEPTEITLMGSHISAWLGSTYLDQLGFCNDDELIATIQPFCSFPILVGYDARHGRLFIPFHQTAHSFVHDHTVCLGDHRAADYWRLQEPEFGVQMSRINAFSPASDIISDGLHQWNWKDHITANTITDIRRRPQGGDQWHAEGEAQ